MLKLQKSSLLSLAQPGRLLRQLRSNSLLLNSLCIMATTLITSGLGYLFWLIAARFFAASDLGLASGLISVATLISNLACLGLGSSLIADLAGIDSPQVWSLKFNTALVAASSFSLLAAVAMVIILPLISPQFNQLHQNLLLVTACIIAIPLWTLSSLFDAAFTAKRTSSKLLIKSLVYSTLKPLLLGVLLLLGFTTVAIFGAWLLATLVALVVGFVLLLRSESNYRLIFAGAFGEFKKLFSTAWLHHLTNIGGMAPMYLLPLLVTIQLGAADNAYFYVTWMLGGLFFMISPAVATALFAEGSYSPAALAGKVRSSSLIIGALLAPATLLFLAGGHLLLSIFGSSYAEHGLILLWLLVLSATPDAITSVYVTILRVRKRLVTAAWLNLSMAFITLLLAWFLLPVMGIAGAGIAWLVAQVLGTIEVFIHSLALRYRKTF